MGILMRAGLILVMIFLVLLLIGWIALFFVLRAYFREFDDTW